MALLSADLFMGICPKVFLCDTCMCYHILWTFVHVRVLLRMWTQRPKVVLMYFLLYKCWVLRWVTQGYTKNNELSAAGNQDSLIPPRLAFISLDVCICGGFGAKISPKLVKQFFNVKMSVGVDYGHANWSQVEETKLMQCFRRSHLCVCRRVLQKLLYI